MTKAYIIEHYGVEWYEQHKANCRRRAHNHYVENRETELERLRQCHKNNPEIKRRYTEKHREVCRINSRDRQRATKIGLLSDNMELHHMKYHSNSKDSSWIEDVVVMSHDDHVLWHKEHPEFISTEHIVS